MAANPYCIVEREAGSEAMGWLRCLRTTRALRLGGTDVTPADTIVIASPTLKKGNQRDA
jgi:hypothetical protein